MSLVPGSSKTSFLSTDSLSPRAASNLAAKGLQAVEIAGADDALVLRDLDGNEVSRWPRHEVGLVQADTLAEAIRPWQIPGDPPAGEAIFVMPQTGAGPRALLERLLLLGREDAKIAELGVSFDGIDASTSIFVRLNDPPLYLLMRARDTPDEQTRVFVRDDQGPLWMEWGCEHPLRAAVVASLTSADRSAWVDRDGTWHLLPAVQKWPMRSLFDAVAPVLEASRETLAVDAGSSRFEIRLHLAPGTPGEAELWLLTPEQLYDLEAFIESSTSEELGRLTVARLHNGTGVVYLLRERVRPGVARVAARLSEYLGVHGYTRVAGADNLYLPNGRRLVPMIRRDDLRELLRLDAHALVILSEDRDGPRIVAIGDIEEAPLLSWIDYVATDRRTVLDLMLEATVFAFPEVTIEWPKKAATPVRPPTATRTAPKRRRTRRRAESEDDEVAEETAVEEQTEETDVTVRLRQLREQARSLELIIAEGGIDDPGVWGDLGYLKRELQEYDEALSCQVAEVFYGGVDGPKTAVRELFHVSARVLGGPVAADRVLELAVRDKRTPDELIYLATGVLSALEGQLPVPDDVIQLVVPTFADPRTAVPRRLAWSVLEAFYRRSGDRLGMTRAKEAILGGVNHRGLSELHDLPRFVRYALALADTPEESGARSVRNYVTALESLLSAVEGSGFEELDVFACYARLVFAVGFMRLGEKKTAMELVAPVEYEFDVHERPNQILYRLYLARVAHEGAGGAPEAWAREVEKLLSPVREKKVLRAVHWLRKRSMWLQIPSDHEAPPRVRPALARIFDRMAAHPQEVAGALGGVLRAQAYYDYELTEAIAYATELALKSGSEAMIRDVLGVAVAQLDSIEILGHQAQAVGSCLRAASLLSDEVSVERLLDRLIELAGNRQLGSVRDLLKAVHPALKALRRFGEMASAEQLLDALEGVSTYSKSGDLQLLAAVSAGRMQLGDGRAADKLVDTAIDEVLGYRNDYVGRYEAAAAVIDVLRHWPGVARHPRCIRFIEQLASFRDTFTTGRYYETHRILTLEHLVDSLGDSETRQSDQVQAFLDIEEHALRRRIIADWNELCGR